MIQFESRGILALYIGLVILLGIAGVLGVGYGLDWVLTGLTGYGLFWFITRGIEFITKSIGA